MLITIKTLLIGLVSLIGAVVLTTTLLPLGVASTTEVDFNGKAIVFDYTDNNTNEDLIIRTNQETYGAWESATVFFSITNESGTDELVHISFLTGTDESVATIYELQEDTPYIAFESVHEDVNYDCSTNWTASTTSNKKRNKGNISGYSCEDTFRVCDSVLGKQCTINEVTGEQQVERYIDTWKEMSETSFNTSLEVNSTKSVPNELIRDKNVLYAISDTQTKYFKAEVDIKPRNGRQQFMIEAYGINGGYGQI